MQPQPVVRYMAARCVKPPYLGTLQIFTGKCRCLQVKYCSRQPLYQPQFLTCKPYFATAVKLTGCCFSNGRQEQKTAAITALNCYAYSLSSKANRSNKLLFFVPKELLILQVKIANMTACHTCQEAVL